MDVSTMTPITFSCTAMIARSATDIAHEILDLSRWSEFTGYGFLPGIQSATFETRTEQIVGSRIAVQNSDGSHHIEAITEWRPGEQIEMRLQEFSEPLNRIADHFVETWTFSEDKNGTNVTRSFALYPTSWATRPLLWFISIAFRRAIQHHLKMMASDNLH